MTLLSTLLIENEKKYLEKLELIDSVRIHIQIVNMNSCLLLIEISSAMDEAI